MSSPLAPRFTGMVFRPFFFSSLCWSAPFLFQNGILIRVLISGAAVGMIYERDEFQKQPFAAHAELLAEALTADVVSSVFSDDWPK